MNPNPKHIVIIPDGNRRYAKKNNISYLETYKKAADKVTECIEWFLHDFKIPILSIYAISFDNVTKRSKKDLAPIYDVQVSTYKKWAKSDLFHKNKINVKFIGEIDLLPKFYQNITKELEYVTKDYKNHKLYILAAYSGKIEVLKAAQLFMKNNGKKNMYNLREKFNIALGVTEPVDLLIRTANEKRLSDCLLYQSAYSEFSFIDKLFPELTKKDILNVLDDFSRRKRKFGN